MAENLAPPRKKERVSQLPTLPKQRQKARGRRSAGTAADKVKPDGHSPAAAHTEGVEERRPVDAYHRLYSRWQSRLGGPHRSLSRALDCHERYAAEPTRLLDRLSQKSCHAGPGKSAAGTQARALAARGDAVVAALVTGMQAWDPNLSAQGHSLDML